MLVRLALPVAVALLALAPAAAAAPADALDPLAQASTASVTKIDPCVDISTAFEHPEAVVTFADECTMSVTVERNAQGDTIVTIVDTERDVVITIVEHAADGDGSLAVTVEKGGEVVLTLTVVASCIASIVGPDGDDERIRNVDTNLDVVDQDHPCTN